MNQGTRKPLIFSLLVILTLVLFLMDLVLGSVSIPIPEILEILFGEGASKKSWETIILEYRLPKAVTAVIVGIGLSISGLQMQTLFRNPLAGPFVLGISSGASLGVALVVLTWGGSLLLSGILGNWIIVGSAIMGSGLVFILVVLVSFRVKDSTSLLILGLMFSSVTGALVTIFQYLSSPEQIQSFLIWTFGNLGGNSWTDIVILTIISSIGILMTIGGIKNLNALLLGEQYAESMGMKIRSARLWIIVTTCLLAGTITAFCGPIAFVGLAVPHMSRLLFQSSNHRILVPGAILIGAALMLFCDIAAQISGYDNSFNSLPINAITSLIGAPFVIWLILNKKNNQTISL